MPKSYPGFTLERDGPWVYYRNKTVEPFESPTSITLELPMAHLISAQEEIASSCFSHVCKAVFDNKGSDLTTYLKGMDFKSPRDAIKQQLSKSRAIKAFEAELLLQSLGFDTPTTLLTGWRQRLFFKDSFFTLSAALIGYEDLYTVVAQLGKQSTQQKRIFIKQFSSTIARMHRDNIGHGDLRAGNVMCQYSHHWKFSFLDNERTRQYAKLPENIRIKNLVQLNLLLSPVISKTDRQRFFNHYSALCYGRTNKDLLNKVMSKTRKRLQIMLGKKKIGTTDLWL
ncbi:hypothetical protein A9Q88_01120 [Gammaproteobacteria bacterium 50_400_T64]|nr:hypothetical protein A9Q88_01120 [Gammaproteobacteria bacterium 50_400_T64]